MLNTDIVTTSSTAIRRNQRHSANHILGRIDYLKFYLDNSLAILNSHSTSIQAPVVDMRLRCQHQLHRTIESGTRIPAWTLLYILQMDSDIQLSCFQILRGIHTKGIIAVGPMASFLSVDTDARLGHRTVEYQFSSFIARRNLYRCLIPPFANPRQSTATTTLLCSLSLAILSDSHTLQVPLLVEWTSNCPVVRDNHLRPRVLVAREFPRLDIQLLACLGHAQLTK